MLSGLLIAKVLNQEFSVMNQDGYIVPGLINIVTSKIVNRDRGLKKAI